MSTPQSPVISVTQDPQNPTSDSTPKGKYVDLSRSVPVSKADGNGGIADSIKNLWRNTMETSPITAMNRYIPLQAWMEGANENAHAYANDLRGAHPVLAAIATAWAGAQKIVTDTMLGISTPKNVGLGILSGGSSLGSQVLRVGLSTYFGYRGAEQMLQGHIANETAYDEAVRRTEGALQVVAGAHGASDTVGTAAGAASAVGIPVPEWFRVAPSALEDALRLKIQRNLGLSGNLADKVFAKVQQAQEIQANADAQQAGVDQTVKSQVDAVSAVGSAGEQAAAAQIEPRLNTIMGLAAQVVAIEKGKFNTEYEAMNKEATAPVTTAEDLKAEIVNSLKAHQLQDAEIAAVEKRIFAAFPPSPRVATDPPPVLTVAERNASQSAANAARQGMIPRDIRQMLRGMNYGRNQIDNAMSAAFPEATAQNQNMSFEDLKRVKDDLFHAGQAATDVNMKRGLDEALANVMGMRSRYAVEHNFGKSNRNVPMAEGGTRVENKLYEDLTRRYMKHMREVGSGKMDEFLRAKDHNDQNLILSTAKDLMTDSAEGLRKLLALHGIDVEPLRAAIEDQKAFEALPGQVMPDIQGQATAQRNLIDTQTGRAIEAIGKKNAIIPGQSDLQLEGKGNLQIRLDALRQIADNARAFGITNPGAYIQLMFGSARLLAGSPLGGFSAMSGGTRLAMETMLKSKSFQDFVAQESGVAGFNPNVVTKADLVTPIVRTAVQEVLKKTTAQIDEELKKPGWTPAQQAAGQPMPEHIHQLVDQANALRRQLERIKGDEVTVKFRLALAKSYPYLEKIALSTVAAGGLNQASQKKSQPLVMPTPPPPAKTSGNITIAGAK